MPLRCPTAESDHADGDAEVLSLDPLEVQRIVNLVGGLVIGMSYAATDRGRDGMPLPTRKRRPGTSPTGP